MHLQTGTIQRKNSLQLIGGHGSGCSRWRCTVCWDAGARTLGPDGLPALAAAKARAQAFIDHKNCVPLMRLKIRRLPLAAQSASAPSLYNPSTLSPCESRSRFFFLAAAQVGAQHPHGQRLRFAQGQGKAASAQWRAYRHRARFTNCWVDIGGEFIKGHARVAALR